MRLTKHCVKLSLLGIATLLPAAPSLGAVTFDWARVGDANNAADWTGRGAVEYDYSISKHEVTNAQYIQFLNAADPTGTNSQELYAVGMTTYNPTSGINFDAGAADGSKYSVQAGRENLPVSYISWNAAARFVNWLHNGQGTGSTETGVYDMSAPIPVRLVNDSYALPTLNEWYKAAHFDPNKAGGAGYWLFANGSDITPVSDNPNSLEFPEVGANFFKDDDTTNNFDDGYAVTGVNTFDINSLYLTDVGAYSQSASAYGTYDQAGNLVEWLETAYGTDRGLRGGGWSGTGDELISWRYEAAIAPAFRNNDTGFRIVLVPEPSMAAFAVIGALAMTRRRQA